MRLHFVPIFAVALISASVAHGADATGTFRGVVRDPDGAIVADATILIQHWQLKDGSLSHPLPLREPLVYTDSQGRFSVQLPPGIYDVFISFPIFSPIAKQVRIEAGRKTKVKCDLRASPFAKYIY
jgi:hypothetical protein